MLELLVEYYEPIKKILFYILIVVIVYLLLMRNRIKSYILNNKEEFKKNPFMIPLIAYLDDNAKNITFVGVIMDMIYIACKDMLDILMKPYYMVVDGIMSLLNSFVKVINTVRKQIAAMKGMLFKIFDDMYSRIESVLGTMTYLFLKMREIMKKTYGVTTLMMYTAEHSFNFFKSIIDSPLGSFSKTLGDSGWFISVYALGFGGIPAWTNIDLCFSPDTLVVVNGKDKPMNDINIGDYIYSDKVIAKINVLYTGQDMYKVKDIIVSGGHAIDIMGNGIRVKDLDKYMKCEKLNEYDQTNLVCFVTDTGYIQVKDGTVFRDYLDTHEKRVHNNVKKMVKKYLNGMMVDHTNDEGIDILSGIILDENISIVNNDKILGDMDIAKNILGMFKLKHMNDNTLYSGSMLILYENRWICINEHPFAEYVSMNKDMVKNWIMIDNIIELSNGVKLRDMIEVGDKKFNDYVSKYLLL